jgi:hypothetical protein
MGQSIRANATFARRRIPVVNTQLDLPAALHMPALATSPSTDIVQPTAPESDPLEPEKRALHGIVKVLNCFPLEMQVTMMKALNTRMMVKLEEQRTRQPTTLSA